MPPLSTTKYERACQASVHGCALRLHLVDEQMKSVRKLGKNHSTITQMDRNKHSDRGELLSLSLRCTMQCTKGLRCCSSAEAGCSTELLALATGRSQAPFPASPRKAYSVQGAPLL